MAKKKYYDFHTRSSQSESRADIKSYEDLIKKIAGLLEAGLSGSIPDIADSIVNMINSEEKKRFLLIIALLFSNLAALLNPSGIAVCDVPS